MVGAVKKEHDFMSQESPIDSELFSRVLDAYDLSVLTHTRIVWVGIGGAAASVENLARAGLGQIVLIDPGIVERCNLATQAYFLRDIGEPKAICLATRLHSLNPAISIHAKKQPLHDISDFDFSQLAFGTYADPQTGSDALVPKQTLIVGATDDFFAQARINRLALHFGIPSVCCQMYLRGLGGEVTFTHPEMTAACHRCILSGRFRAYLKEGYRNSVGSNGTPICSTTRLNAITEFIILAILHHGTTHPHWGDMLKRIGNHNLIQIRNHPDAEEFLGFKNFSNTFATVENPGVFTDETIWRAQFPEHPNTGYSRPCPDCGGHGELARCKGAFADTRMMIPEP